MNHLYNDRNEKVICDICESEWFKEEVEFNGVQVCLCNGCGVRRTVDEWRKVKRKVTIFREKERGLF